MDDPNAPSEAEKRSARRQRVLKRARIVFNDGYAVFDCMVRNLSGGGALLEFGSPIGVPQSFALLMDAGKPRPCTVVWHRGTRFGVRFVA